MDIDFYDTSNVDDKNGNAVQGNQEDDIGTVAKMDAKMDANMVDSSENPAPLSLSRHVHSKLRLFTSTSTPVEEIAEQVDSILPFLQEVDAYIVMSNIATTATATATPPRTAVADLSTDTRTKATGSTATADSSTAFLPELDWNRQFRKAYNLMFWVRAVAAVDHDAPTSTSATHASTSATHASTGTDTGTGTTNTSTSTRPHALLYRFSSAPPNDSTHGTGVEVAISSQWKLNHDQTKLSTMLTAFSLPTNSKYVSCPLILQNNKWSLIGINHVFPYLKPPQWTMCVDGRIMGTGEVTYPVLEGSLMSYNSLFTNIWEVGCIWDSTQQSDDTKTAKQLNTTGKKIYNLHWHVASLALHPDSVPPSLQALLSEAGPNLSLQQNGRLLVQLPPVSNWSKGSSLEGPNVGIPLCTSLQALEVQRLASRVVHAYSAANLRVFGAVPTNNSDGNVTRIILHASRANGNTDQTPKVGLIQPSPPENHVNTQDQYLYFKGDGLTVKHNLSEFLLHTNDGARVDTQLGLESSKLLGVVFLEQSIVPASVMCFFRSLTPPGFLADLQDDLYSDSLLLLHGLYKPIPPRGKTLGALFIRLLASLIQYGGGRVHEEVLQSGILHILGTTLRRSLVRAHALGLLKRDTNMDPNDPNHCSYIPLLEFLSHKRSHRKIDYQILSQADHDTCCPPVVPTCIAESCVSLIHACCGPSASTLNVLTPAMKVRRSSDLALTAVFGFGLNLDLWGDLSLRETEIVFRSVAERYGGGDISYGAILRSQIPVQSLLDVIKLRFDKVFTASISETKSTNNSNTMSTLENVADHLSQLLFSMLLASLSNRRVVSQAEHDVSACMGALSDSPLGSIGCHVILTAFELVLQWCDILPSNPVEVSQSSQSSQFSTKASLLDIQERNSAEQERKIQVAARLGRNLLITQYHDVVAPMLLSRTLFCGERTMSSREQSPHDNSNTDAEYVKEDIESSLSWKYHWRISLLLFTWVTSISGVDGEVATRSTGSLLLASSLTGSLNGCLVEHTSMARQSNNCSKKQQFVSTLLLPPPVMALTIGSSSMTNRDKGSWSYTDLLTDRLRVTTPLLPGLVVSLVSHPEDTDIISSSEIDPIDASSLNILKELIDIVGSSFDRVYSSIRNCTMNEARKVLIKRRKSVAHSTAVKAAKDYIPHLLVVVVLLENHIHLRRSTATSSSSWELNDDDIEVFSSFPKSCSVRKERSVSDSEWVSIPTLGEIILGQTKPGNYTETTNKLTTDDVLKRLVNSQNIILDTVSDLIINAMKHGGGEASMIVWRTVISALHTSNVYSKKSFTKSTELDTIKKDNRTTTKETTGSRSTGYANHNSGPDYLVQNVLCRLVALVLIKALTRENESDMWHEVLCSAISRLCDLVEEKALLSKPFETILSRPRQDSTSSPYSHDQTRLIYSIVEIMTFGRKFTGWHQLPLTSAPLLEEISYEYKGACDNEAQNKETFTERPTPTATITPESHTQAAVLSGENLSPRHSPKSPVLSSSPSNKRLPIKSVDTHSLLLLPILQPCLRIVVGCVDSMRYKVTIVIPHAVESQNEQGKQATKRAKVPVLPFLAKELRHTLTDAIFGLSFPNARDIALNTLAALRRATICQRNANDEDAIELCCSLFLSIIEEIRMRYKGEQHRRQVNLLDSYEPEKDVNGNISPREDDDEGACISSEVASEDAESSREVERMILGGDLIPKLSDKSSTKQVTEAEEETVTFNTDTEKKIELMDVRSEIIGGREDFIMFHDVSDDGAAKDGSVTKLGWSHYKGLSVALERCAELSKTLISEGHEQQVEAMLTVLTCYLDTWDESVARETVESEVIEIFDESLSFGSKDENSVSSSPLSLKGSSHKAGKHSMPISGSETAADAMSNFIELSAIEKSRLKEVSSTTLPARRYSCMSFAERFCWAQYMEFAKDEIEGSTSKLWERCTSDGNRDVRSRLISIPCNPQFKRYIPAYLDHGSTILPEENETIDDHVKIGEADTIGEAPERKEGIDDNIASAEIDDTMKSLASSPESLRIAHEKSIRISRDKRDNTAGFVTGDDIDYQRALAVATNMEIVDITKKEMVDEANEEIPTVVPNNDEFDLEDERNMSDDDNAEGSPYLGFPEEKPKSETLNVDDDGSPYLDFPNKDNESIQKDSDDKMSIDLVGTTATTKATWQEDLSDKTQNLHHAIVSSSFSHAPDNSSSTTNPLHSSAARMIEMHFDNCLHVKTEGCRKCTILLSATHLIIDYDTDSAGLFDGEMLATQEEAERQRIIEEVGGTASGEYASEEAILKRQRETASLRPKSMRFNLSELSHVYLRRYRLRDSALEMFFLPSGGSSFGGFGLYAPATSLFLDCGPGYEGNIRRDDAAHGIMKRAPPQTIKQWPDRSGQFLHEQLSRLTMGWVEGRITNFDYLLHLNILAGRSYNDLCQYPVMPWVLSNYNSEEIPDLCDRSNFRDLSKPMGALNPNRLDDFMERFESFSDPTIPPFMYGSHYSTNAGVVLHFLVRMHPFSGLHRQLQGGHFDVADRLFSSIPRTWDMCTGSSVAEVKELTPEWYCNPSFLKNTNKFKLGTAQDGETVGDVILPPWADGSPEKFIEFMRKALESDICSEMLPHWIDLIFGRKQQGPESIKAYNVFFYLTYYGSVDVAAIKDEALRTATELQIAHFGQCPMQLFRRPHVHRVQNWRNFCRQTFYQMLSTYTLGAGPGKCNVTISSSNERSPPLRKIGGAKNVNGEPLFLPFVSAPMTHWVHLAAPPPGPHADLIAVRLAGIDRCLAVDAQGIFHSFRWAWKPEEETADEKLAHVTSGQVDRGCFVAQRELPRFRTVPRLPHVSTKHSGNNTIVLPAIGISKTLFAGRSVLLVLSDGDGRGALAMQLVDPAKGSVRGQAIVPSVHSSRITCIAMDPIGTAAGHGGVGGELAILGSADGGASIWRFMSSHYFPLRPRVRMRGHGGCTVYAAALNGAIHVCATVSENRCCIFSIGNGAMIRSFPPPSDSLDASCLPTGCIKAKTVFADTPALCLSVQGFLVCVCKTTIAYPENVSFSKAVITLHLFSPEGVSLGSKALESWRGVPHKLTCTPDGTAITVCSGRGMTVHRLSAITPLEFIDEWQVAESEHLEKNLHLDENLPKVWDVDFGPSIMRPIVGAAACSSGTLRLHALPGISAWADKHKKSSVASTVGQAFAKPAQRIKKAFGKGLGLGNKVVGVGKDISREVSSDVKEKGVGGFLGGFMARKSNKL